MNNKGFMMAEVIVVASIVLVAFAFFYMNYNGIIVEYNKRIDYYDVTTLYELAKFRDDTVSYGMTDDDFDNEYKLLYKIDGKYDGVTMEYYDINIYVVRYNRIMTLANEASNLNKTFVDYLTYLRGKVAFEYRDYVLVMEKCKNDATDCKYAYLETAVK